MVFGLAGRAMMREPLDHLIWAELARARAVLEGPENSCTGRPRASAHSLAFSSDSRAWRSPAATMSQVVLGVRKQSRTASQVQVKSLPVWRAQSPILNRAESVINAA